MVDFLSRFKTYTFTTVKGLLGSGIQIGTELGESSDLTVLGQEKLEGTSDLLHGLKLGSGTDTGHGQTDVNGRSDTLVEEFGFQEDLSISNRNDVGWDISGHITTLGLDNGKSSEGATTVLVAHLGSTLEETRVEVKYISWVGLTSGRTTEKQRHLTVCNSLDKCVSSCETLRRVGSSCLFAEIIKHDYSMLSIVTEPR